jgi:putative oxidoreductase
MKNSNGWIMLLRLLLGGLFIYAGVGKIWNPSNFSAAIDNYRMLPYALVPIMAAVLPWVEVLCGLLLIFNRWLLGAGLIMIVLNAMFLIAIGAAMVRGLDIDCGCFSAAGSASRVGAARLLEDVLFLVAAVIIFRHALFQQKSVLKSE